MNYGQIVNRVWSDNVLFSVMFELTYQCNLDCFFCYNDLELRGKPLSEQQYIDILQELAELQVLNVTLSGGEPLAHPAFFRIGARARDLGFLVRIKSNGHALNARLAKRVKMEIDPFVIDISLHGAQAQTHDRQTRVPGSFKCLLNNLAIMKQLGLRIKLNAILTAWNEDELEDMYVIADDLDLPITMDPTVTPRDNGDQSPKSIRPSASAVRHLFKYQAQRDPDRFRPFTTSSDVKQKKNCDGEAGATGDKHCGAGSSTLSIDPYGSVFPCVQWRRPLGNLHKQSITEIWQEGAGLDSVRKLGPKIKSSLKELGSAAPHMAFCPGLAELESDSPLKLYPAALEKLEVVGCLQQKIYKNKE